MKKKAFKPLPPEMKQEFLEKIALRQHFLQQERNV